MTGGDGSPARVANVRESTDGESRTAASPQPGDSGTINIGLWNIRCGRNGGLEFAARGMKQMGMDIAIFQEAKLTEGKYTKGTSGYKVFASNAQSTQKGGVALLWVEDHDLFEIESVRFPTADVLTFQLITGDSKWFVVSGYIAPGDKETVVEMRKRIEQRPTGF